FARFLLAAGSAIYRYAVRHQGAAAKRLPAPEGGAQLFRRFRSVRRLRSDLRGIETELEDRRSAGSLREPHLWRDANLPLPPRADAAAHDVVRVSAHQGAVTNGPRASNEVSLRRH